MLVILEKNSECIHFLSDYSKQLLLKMDIKKIIKTEEFDQNILICGKQNEILDCIPSQCTMYWDYLIEDIFLI